MSAFNTMREFIKGLKATHQDYLMRRVVPGTRMGRHSTWYRLEMSDGTVAIFTDKWKGVWTNRAGSGYYLKAAVTQEQFLLDAWPLI